MGYCVDSKKGLKFGACDGRHKVCDRSYSFDTYNGLNSGCSSYCRTVKEAKELHTELYFEVE